MSRSGSLPASDFGVTRSGNSVTIGRGAFDEVYHLGLDRVEQTFVSQSLPGSGELSVRLGVKTELVAHESVGPLSFLHPEFWHVAHGSAMVIDARCSTGQATSSISSDVPTSLPTRITAKDTWLR